MAFDPTTRHRRITQLLTDRGQSLCGRRVLAMCSGGVDSVALVDLLATLPKGARPASIEVLFLDHGLRDIEEDRAAARAIAGAHSLQFHEEQWSEPASGNTQAEARAWRYEVAERVAAGRDCDVVVTAHHADDQLETVLLGLATSSGPAAMAGIAAVRE